MNTSVKSTPPQNQQIKESTTIKEILSGQVLSAPELVISASERSDIPSIPKIDAAEPVNQAPVATSEKQASNLPEQTGPSPVTPHLALPSDAKSEDQLSLSQNSNSPTSQNAPHATASESEAPATEPNAALLKLTPSDSPSEIQTLKEPLVLGTAFLVCLALVAAFVKKKYGGNSKVASDHDDENQPLQITQTLLLSPKRKISVLKHGNKELLIANTEHGITVLSENPKFKAMESQSEWLGRNQGNYLRDSSPKVDTQSTPHQALSSHGKESPSTTPQAKLLAEAIQKLKSAREQESPEQKEKAEFKSPTLTSPKKSVPKYLAQEFESEGKRLAEGAENKSTPKAPNSIPPNELTALIRSKMKELRSIA